MMICYRLVVLGGFSNGGIANCKFHARLHKQICSCVLNDHEDQLEIEFYGIFWPYLRQNEQPIFKEISKSHYY